MLEQSGGAVVHRAKHSFCYQVCAVNGGFSLSLPKLLTFFCLPKHFSATSQGIQLAAGLRGQENSQVMLEGF